MIALTGLFEAGSITTPPSLHRSTGRQTQTLTGLFEAGSITTMAGMSVPFLRRRNSYRSL